MTDGVVVSDPASWWFRQLGRAWALEPFVWIGHERRVSRRGHVLSPAMPGLCSPCSRSAPALPWLARFSLLTALEPRLFPMWCGLLLAAGLILKVCPPPSHARSPANSAALCARQQPGNGGAGGGGSGSGAGGSASGGGSSTSSSAAGSSSSAGAAPSATVCPSSIRLLHGGHALVSGDPKADLRGRCYCCVPRTCVVWHAASVRCRACCNQRQPHRVWSRADATRRTLFPWRLFRFVVRWGRGHSSPTTTSLVSQPTSKTRRSCRQVGGGKKRPAACVVATLTLQLES